MKLIFVRHGHHINDQLTKLGKKQCKLVCSDLDYENPEVVYCSPANRTVQTAKIICKNLGICDIIIDKRLMEREQLRTISEDPEIIKYNDNYLNYNFSHINPEGCKEFCDRVFAFMDEIVAKYGKTDKCILVVGHSSLVYAMNTYMTGMPKDKQIVWVRLGNCSKICFEIKK